MPISVGIGFSDHSDIIHAAREAALQARSMNSQAKSSLVLLFGTPGYIPNQDALTAIDKVLLPDNILFAMTSGIFLNEGIKPRGLGLLSIAGTDIRCKTFFQNQISLMNPEDAGQKISHNLLTGNPTIDHKLLLYFLGGLSKNNGGIVRGLREEMGAILPMIGGFSHDGTNTARSLVGLRDNISNDAVTGFLLSGDVVCASSMHHGWHPLGRPRTITSSDKNIIISIDDKPAVTIYEDYCKEELAKLAPGKIDPIAMRYPLGISTGIRRKYLVLAPVEVLPDGSLVCQTDIPEESSVHIMIADKDAMQSALQLASLEVKEEIKNRPASLLLLFCSLARERILGRQINSDLSAIKDIFGMSTPIFGMYTYGESGPFLRTAGSFNTYVQHAHLLINAFA